MKVVEFARNINTDRNNVYDIYQRSSIDTELLVRISETLKYDFFHLYSHNALQKKFGHDYRDAYTAYGNEANHDLLYLEERIKNLEKRLDDKEEIICNRFNLRHFFRHHSS